MHQQLIDTFSLAGRVAVITGAASGIGRETACVLAQAGEPRDIALAALYLASDASRFVTGQILRPNGGVAMP